MKINPNAPQPLLLGQLYFFMISLLDDLLLLVLSQWGLHVSWLEAWLRWLAPVILIYTVIQIAWQLYEHWPRNSSWANS